MTPGAVFDEHQRPPRGYVVTGAIALAFAAGVVLWFSALAGSLQWDLLAFLALGALVVGFTQMRTVVTTTQLRVSIVPFPRKTIALADVETCEPETYRPLLHYGGWGWKWSPSRGWAYTMRGNRGVRIRLRNGKTFLIGSQRPDELAAAIRSSTRAVR